MHFARSMESLPPEIQTAILSPSSIIVVVIKGSDKGAPYGFAELLDNALFNDTVFFQLLFYHFPASFLGLSSLYGFCFFLCQLFHQALQFPHSFFPVPGFFWHYGPGFRRRKLFLRNGNAVFFYRTSRNPYCSYIVFQWLQQYRIGCNTTVILPQRRLNLGSGPYCHIVARSWMAFAFN